MDANVQPFTHTHKLGGRDGEEATSSISARRYRRKRSRDGNMHMDARRWSHRRREEPRHTSWRIIPGGLVTTLLCVRVRARASLRYLTRRYVTVAPSLRSAHFEIAVKLNLNQVGWLAESQALINSLAMPGVEALSNKQSTFSWYAFGKLSLRIYARWKDEATSQ